MHESVMGFLAREMSARNVAGRDVLEVGSQDVNGSPRSVLEPLRPRSYLGVDASAGRGVDLVLDVSRLVTRLGPERFDVVVSTEMLEHAQDWRAAVRSMKSVLRQGGILVVTTRGPGFPFHCYPHDYWRFTVRDFAAIFSDMAVLRLTPDTAKTHPGVFLKARKIRRTGAVNLSKIVVAEV